MTKAKVIKPKKRKKENMHTHTRTYTHTHTFFLASKAFVGYFSMFEGQPLKDQEALIGPTYAYYILTRPTITSTSQVKMF